MSAMQNALDQLTAQTGQETGVSDWMIIDQSRVNTFAEITHDPQFIHTDPERAKRETPFGGTIAHGFLTLSLAVHFAESTLPPLPGQVMGMNYGFNKIRFLSPVRTGKRIRCRFTLLNAERRGDNQVLMTTGLTFEIEGEDKPAAVAEWLGLSFFAD